MTKYGKAWKRQVQVGQYDSADILAFPLSCSSIHRLLVLIPVSIYSLEYPARKRNFPFWRNFSSYRDNQTFDYKNKQSMMMFRKQSNYRKRKEAKQRKVHRKNTTGITWDVGKQQFHARWYKKDLGFYQTRMEAILARDAFASTGKRS